MNAVRLAAVTVVVATSLVVSAAEPLNIRPGVWKITTTLTLGGAPLYIEGMPEASKAEYAKRWAQDAGKTQTDTDDDCITEKDIRTSDIFKDMRDDANACTQKISRQTASAVSGTLECKNPKTVTKTELDYSAQTPTTMTGTIRTTITSPNGTTTMNATMSGRWMAPNCPAEESGED
ncbi:MAG: DUF3617 family protein [Steroidobacteraceae bacterium]